MATLVGTTGSATAVNTGVVGMGSTRKSLPPDRLPVERAAYRQADASG
ncbi:hypothetical protein ACIBVL_29565 [Streptomyces sp. NPDC049687]